MRFSVNGSVPTPEMVPEMVAFAVTWIREHAPEMDEREARELEQMFGNVQSMEDLSRVFD